VIALQLRATSRLSHPRANRQARRSIKAGEGVRTHSSRPDLTRSPPEPIDPRAAVGWLIERSRKSSISTSILRFLHDLGGLVDTRPARNRSQCYWTSSERHLHRCRLWGEPREIRHSRTSLRGKRICVTGKIRRGGGNAAAGNRDGHRAVPRRGRQPAIIGATLM
jgi:hypothetical protein